MRPLAILSTLIALPCGATAALAQDQGSVELAYQRAIANCMLNHLDPQTVPGAFRSTGFAVGRDAEGQFAGKDGVRVLFEVTSVGGPNFCKIESDRVAPARAELIGRQLADHFFAGMVEEGGPEDAMDCPTISIFAPRSLMVMTFYDAGNGGTCNGSGGSSVALSF